jgi:hypothetical protein
MSPRHLKSTVENLLCWACTLSIMNYLPNLSLFYQLAYFTTDDGISDAINFTLGTHTAIRWCRFAVSAASSLRSIALDRSFILVFPTQSARLGHLVLKT